VTVTAKESVGMRLAEQNHVRAVGLSNWPQNTDEEFMNSAQKQMTDPITHRGCGLRPASYEIAPQVWLPEACVWLQTETGLRRLWIHSFAHCFDAERLTFSNQSEADHWALSAARAIVDRALDKPELSVPSRIKTVHSLASRWNFARYLAVALFGLKFFR
jgi:hypothetical protein